jgi:hypothetical protein
MEKWKEERREEKEIREMVGDWTANQEAKPLKKEKKKSLFLEQ